MTDDQHPSLLLCLYYGFLLVTTALSYGYPYPLFGWLLDGLAARVAIAVDCLVLLHIVVGVWKAQRLSWYLLIGYNLFELASLAATLLLLGPSQFASAYSEQITTGSFYTGALVAAAVMALVTLHAFRRKASFRNKNPYLF